MIQQMSLSVVVVALGTFPIFLGALKGTELGWQREPKTQIFAENRRFSQIHPFSWEIQPFEGAENRRFSQETADWAPSP